MRNFLILIFSLLIMCTNAQNNARLFSAKGELFSVFINEKAIKPTAEANVLIENISEDTLQLRVAFENQKPFEITIYLLDKGKKTRDREYVYKLSFDGVTIKTTFLNIVAPVSLPEPLVPQKPNQQQ